MAEYAAGGRGPRAVRGPDSGLGRMPDHEGETEPTDPAFAAVWLDTSGDTPVLKVYDGQDWHAEPTEATLPFGLRARKENPGRGRGRGRGRGDGKGVK